MNPPPRFVRARIPRLALATLLAAGSPGLAPAQFLDEFDGPLHGGWDAFTGDGEAIVNLVQMDGYARIEVDARADRHNVWWAIIKRDVSSYLDLQALQDSAHELRVEARVRPSHAPRRVNFMLNTQRTRDFHEHLREYDLADTDTWRTISMTTREFDAAPGDAVYVQLGVTDWGLDTYHLDVDYYRADVVAVAGAGADLGEPLAYHPPVPDLATFSHHLPVAEDAMIHAGFPAVNFNDWHVEGPNGVLRVLSVNADQWVLLRWTFDSRAPLRADGAGVLELTTHSLATGGDFVARHGEDLGNEFGKLRVVEILGGDPAWERERVTWDGFIGDQALASLFNGQMVFDAEVAPGSGGQTLITLPRPVLQRLLDGTTRGLLLRPLGAINASFYASGNPGRSDGPMLHFNLAR